jgi:serralysin
VRVTEIAKDWLRGTGLKFGFTDDASVAQIRTSFQCGGNWSYLGTDALAIPRPDPTMCLNSIKGLGDRDTLAIRKTVLLEFGHALGLINEMQNPNASLEWNKEVVYRQMYSQGMTRESVEANVFNKSSLRNYRPFDPQSVMMFRIPKEWLINESHGYEGGSELSVGDREFIQKLYPSM